MPHSRPPKLYTLPHLAGKKIGKKNSIDFEAQRNVEGHSTVSNKWLGCFWVYTCIFDILGKSDGELMAAGMCQLTGSIKITAYEEACPGDTAPPKPDHCHCLVFPQGPAEPLLCQSKHDPNPYNPSLSNCLQLMPFPNVLDQHSCGQVAEE